MSANEALAEAYLQLLDMTRDNVERYEHNMNMACAFAWDMGRLVTEVKCYWCGKVLGSAHRDADAIREHTANCEKRPAPKAAIAAAVAAERKRVVALLRDSLRDDGLDAEHSRDLLETFLDRLAVSK